MAEWQAGDPDPAVRAMNARSKAGEVVDFNWLMARHGQRNDERLHELLRRGRTVPDTVPLLDQYLKSYGQMVASQWRHAARLVPLIVGPVRWIDYGCGQGLAGMLLNDLIGAELFKQVAHIALIEPSSPAMARAASIYTHLAPSRAIDLIEARFDDIPATALHFADPIDTVHVFSNVLDVPGFNAEPLLQKALTPGRHLLLVVGNDRDVEGGTQRILNAKKAVEHPNGPGTVLNWSRYEQFTCDNRNRAKAVLWFCGLEVHHG